MTLGRMWFPRDWHPPYPQPFITAKRCIWCGRKPNRRNWKPNARTREHIMPKSKGGSNSLRNMGLACKECNQRRGNDDSWLPYMSVAFPRLPESQRQWLKALRVRAY